MWVSWPLVVLLPAVCGLFPGRLPDEGDVRHLYPITHIIIGLSDHAHVLPYLLGWLENLDYPKHRLHLEVYLNGKEDTTQDQLLWWKDSMSPLYLSFKTVFDEENWMEAGLRSARIRKTSNVLLLSGDTLPRESRIIQLLSSNPTHLVVCPLLNPISEGMPWNVEDLAESIQTRETTERQKLEVAALPMLIRLDVIDASYLTFSSDNLPNYYGAGDPLEVFAQSAERMKINIWLDYSYYFGVYIEETLELDQKRRAIRYHLCDLVADGVSLPVYSRTVRPWTPEPELLGMDRVYVINLKRRSDRLKKMGKIFEILGVDYSVLEATDGARLPPSLPYSVLSGYLDPFHKRPIKTGEVGCFLSHYRIWEEVVRGQLSHVIVFEDDLRFSFGGLERIREVNEDLAASKLEWDLIYLGRKKQADQEEVWVKDHSHLSTVGYSYWTLGYMLSLSGAKKLVEAKPLEKILPVDEYLPIMFDRHPNQEWSSHFAVRDLRAFTLYPLVVTPQKYTNEAGYVSDTEDSKILNTVAAETAKDEL